MKFTSCSVGIICFKTMCGTARIEGCQDWKLNMSLSPSQARLMATRLGMVSPTRFPDQAILSVLHPTPITWICSCQGTNLVFSPCMSVRRRLRVRGRHWLQISTSVTSAPQTSVQRLCHRVTGGWMRIKYNQDDQLLFPWS